MKASLRLRLSALSAVAFAGVGIQAPFLPVWLEGRGLDATTIGLVVALPVCVRVLASTPLVATTDRGVTPRALLASAHLALGLAFALLLAAPNAWAIAGVVVLAALAQSSIVPATDLVLTDAVRENRALDYGRLRVFGSLAFLASSVAMGYVLEVAPLDFVVYGLVAAGFLGALVATTTPPLASERDLPPREGPRPRLPPALLLAIVGAACVQASHAGVYAFGSIHWRAIGFSGSTVGWLWAIGVVAEVALFVVAGRFVGRGRGLPLVVIGALAAIVRFGGLALEPGPLATFALQSLHGLSFGATHLGAMAILTAMAPPGARGKAQGLFAAAQAVGMACATVAGGMIYEHAGGLVFLAMVPLPLAGLACLALSRRAALKGSVSAPS
ncbi:MFS transporter [Salinarimonas ramus]|uniref:MFS transporter n=1 Tax=Salinarimonas ramus TaxID=690164 RepID=A0A917Q4P2_9HYPH|nr:MFS transporter [Salinarimonas ramus]GGK22785.1 MFS transporter [Salinarimonas ramus]